MFQKKVLAKIKTLYSVTFSQKSRPLGDNVKKYGTAEHATDHDMVRRISFTCWTTKTTDTDSEFVTLIVFPRQQWFRKRASVLSTNKLPVFFLNSSCRSKCISSSTLFHWIHIACRNAIKHVS